MEDFIRSLFIEPLNALIAVLVIWGALYIFLVRLSPLDKSTWIKLEFIWIFAGLLGLLSLVFENNRLVNENELKSNEVRLNYHYRGLKSELNGGRHCMNFHNSGLFSKEEFQRRQSRADSICAWANSMKDLVNSLDTENFEEIDDVPVFNVSESETVYFYETVLWDIEQISKLKEERTKLQENLKRNDWENFRRTLGVILIIIAFGLRLAIVSNKVYENRKRI